MEYTNNLQYNEISIVVPYSKFLSGEQLSIFTNRELSRANIRESMTSFGVQFRPL